MKKILLATLFFAVMAFATDYYDQYGHKTGRATTSGNQTNYYDQNGHNTGRSVQNGNQTNHYDQNGHSTGRSR